MGEFRQTATIFVSTLAVSMTGFTLVAQAQNSPFAKKGPQAWESPGAQNTNTLNTNAQNTNTQGQLPSGSTYQYQYSTGSKPAGSSPQQGSYNQQYPSTLTYGSPVPTISTKPAPQTGSAPSGSYASTYNYSLPTQSAPATSPSAPSLSGGSQSYTGSSPQTGQVVQGPGASYEYPSYNRMQKPAPTVSNNQAQGSYYPGRVHKNNQAYNQTYGQPYQNQSGGYYNPQYNAGHQTPYPTPQGQGQTTRSNQSWSDRLGLGNIEFSYDGYIRTGAAATYQDIIGANDSLREDFILDGSIRAEVSAITQGGLEYGVAGEVRGQYDQYRRGFGGRVGDCPAGIINCPSVNIGGTDFALRGHTSRFYLDGANDAKDFEYQIESAHLFLRSSYGDVTIGRDDGAAYLFSLGAPSLLSVGGSNNPVDYTGLDAVKTINDASGFSEKITYTSPRLLGDQIGLGIQLGASYALDAEACGVDYCVRGNDDEPTGVLAPDLEDIVEFGLALDRTFDNGLSIEATATYAMGSEQSALPVFDDLKALGLGLELGYDDFVLGGSYLHSNNGLFAGDYEAMDVGLTWKPSKFGVTLGYGHATDDNVGLTSDQAVIGLSYDWRENFRIGTGVQYVNRDINLYDATSGLVSGRNENATSAFVETRFTF